MKKIALIVLYYGELPQYTKLFFDSLKYNPTIDVLLFTDQEVKYDGKNLIQYKGSFDNMVKRIQSNFEFKITCDRPYKLCDYRPAYGYIFKEELKEYDFWGHCDLDMILGNLRKYLPEQLLDKYSKIYQHGHLCLYKNTNENNIRFMEKGGKNYKEVFTTSISCIFDEVEGIQKKYDLLNIPTYKNRVCADISPWHDDFQVVESYLSKEDKINFNYEQQVFYWEKGHIFRAYINKRGDVQRDEFNYLHFQRRNMDFDEDVIKNDETFFITRQGIIKKEDYKLPSVEKITELNSKRKIKELQKKIEYYIYIWKRRFNKYILQK